MAISKNKNNSNKQKSNKFYVDNYNNIHGPEVESFIGRAIYVNLDEPNTYQPDKPSFGLTILLPKSPAQGFTQRDLDKAEQVIKNIEGVAKEVIAEHAKYKMFDPQGFLKDGDEKLNADGEVRDEFKNHWFISLNNKKQVVCVGRKGEVIPFDFIKGGMKVRVKAKVVASTPSGSPKLSLKPVCVQFVEDDGVRLGGRDVTKGFSDLEELPLSDMSADDVTEVPAYFDGEEDELDRV